MTRFLYVVSAASLVAILPIPTNNRLLVQTAKAASNTFTVSGTWTVPTGVNSIVVETWGGGGAGGGITTPNGSGGGGGGGAYAKATVSVTSGNTYNFTVGTGGIGGTTNGGAGGATFWDTGTVVRAAGGSGGVSAANGAGGSGGTTLASVGTTLFAGGTGGNGISGTSSGGGGGGAGSLGGGGNATGVTAGTGTTIGGGNGAPGITVVNTSGSVGNIAGGGGSGGFRKNKNNCLGGNGAIGQIVITYPIVSITIPTSGSITYGFVGAGASKDTTTSGVNSTQSVQNNGDVAVDINIAGQNSANWTLAVSPGVEQYSKAVCISGSGSPDPCDAGATWTPLSTSYQSLVTNLGASAQQRFDLKLMMPSTTNATAQQNVGVTIMAVQH